MKDPERNQIISEIVKLKVRITFEEPNSEASRKLSKAIAQQTGLSHLEIHRFHNAILSGNLEHSFVPSRTTELARIILKAIVRKEKYPFRSELRGDLSKFANEKGFSFNSVLEVFKEITVELANEVFSPQSKA